MNFNENVESELPVRASMFGDETPIQVSTIDDLESTSTWEESGWDDENVLPESEQPQPSLAVNVEALNEELRSLREQMEVAQQQQQTLQQEKEEQKQHKDTVIAKLKGKLRATIAERNQLKEQSSAGISTTTQLQEDLREELESINHKLREALSERDELKEKLEESLTTNSSDQNVDELKNEMEAVKMRKDEVIAKLKLKLKQTIRLKENLQVEVERVSAEKDVVFNEFSDKMQQQNRESDQLKRENDELNQSMHILQSQIENKMKETDSLSESFNEKAAVVEDMIVDMDDLRAKHTALVDEHQRLKEEAASQEQQLSEKFEWESSEKDDLISDLERDLRDGKEEWDEVRKTLEEALQIKDEAVTKVKEQLDNLHREHAKLNAQAQSNAHKTQSDVEEYADKIKSLEEQCAAEKKAKEDERIKTADIQTQLEAVEILFGLSDSDDLSLVERLSNWKQQTVDEYKTLERAHKELSLIHI